MEDKVRRLSREHRFRESQRARGFEQVRVWVPVDKIEKIREQARKYRENHK